MKSTAFPDVRNSNRHDDLSWDMVELGPSPLSIYPCRSRTLLSFPFIESANLRRADVHASNREAH
jgi:hypothetical protein